MGDEYLFGPPIPIKTSGIDFAVPGTDRMVWYCSVCGMTDYPCNHVKDIWARQRKQSNPGGQPK